MRQSAVALHDNECYEKWRRGNQKIFTNHYGQSLGRFTYMIFPKVLANESSRSYRVALIRYID